MPESKLGLLVKEAKGDDRSLREYARASGVDVAVISKIINGTYTPKKKEVFYALTSAEADPRGNVTHQQLIEAAGLSNSSSSLTATGVGLVAAGSAVAAIGGFPFALLGLGTAGMYALLEGISNSKKKEDIKKKADRAINQIQRFVAMTNGLIYGNLGAKGIIFRIVPDKEKLTENEFDTYLELENSDIQEYVFRYAFLDDEYQKNKTMLEKFPKRLIEELMFTKPSSKRKVSVVTNCADAYDYLLQFKNMIAYNGELSIVLVDVKNVKLLKEDYLSHYTGNATSEELIIV